MSPNKPLRFFLMIAGMIVADCASATERVAFDQCQIYGYVPHSRDYAQCRMNLRRLYTTGPCGYASFAAMHREYCHLNPPPFI